MAARVTTGNRPGARFAQFKLVLLGMTPAISPLCNFLLTLDQVNPQLARSVNGLVSFAFHS